MSFLPLSCCDCRKEGDYKRGGRAINPAAGDMPRIVGLGITFREDFNGGLHVHELLEGGAGSRCGKIQVPHACAHRFSS